MRRFVVILSVTFLALAAAAKDEPKSLTPEGRIVIIRQLSSEFCKAKQAFPAGKKGVDMTVGQGWNEAQARQLIANSGASIRPGDTVQITAITFRADRIIFELNGGGKKKRHWYERIRVGVGGPAVVVADPNAAPPTSQGSWLTLIFPGQVPEMTPEQVKEYLAAVFDFSKQRSAAANWVETLPKEFQQAIKDRKAIVGMDRDMVLAAMGRPDRKVREKDGTGVEREDWIYGYPPAKVTFVTFVVDKVVQVRDYQ